MGNKRFMRLNVEQNRRIIRLRRIMRQVKLETHKTVAQKPTALTRKKGHPRISTAVPMRRLFDDIPYNFKTNINKDYDRIGSVFSLKQGCCRRGE